VTPLVALEWIGVVLGGIFTLGALIAVGTIIVSFLLMLWGIFIDR
jgi:hypothetical protein